MFIFFYVTGVSACMSVLGTITHSLCICHLAIKLYCVVFCKRRREDTVPIDYILINSYLTHSFILLKRSFLFVLHVILSLQSNIIECADLLKVRIIF